ATAPTRDNASSQYKSFRKSSTRRTNVATDFIEATLFESPVVSRETQRQSAQNIPSRSDAKQRLVDVAGKPQDKVSDEVLRSRDRPQLQGTFSRNGPSLGRLKKVDGPLSERD